MKEPHPFRSLEEKKRENHKTYKQPMMHEFISSKQLNMPLLGAYEFVITVAPVVACVSAILAAAREEVFK